MDPTKLGTPPSTSKTPGQRDAERDIFCHMSPSALDTILVIAATERELAPVDGWRRLCCGVGPVEAGIATARAIAEQPPRAILHVGIAGARRSRAIPPASLVIGTSSVYDDLADLPPEWAVKRIVPPAELLEAMQCAAPDAYTLAIGTSGRVGGTRADACDVEAMEGFAVLRAAQQAGVPAIEVRAIANEIEETDRTRWHFDAAFAAITAATPALVRELAACVR